MYSYILYILSKLFESAFAVKRNRERIAKNIIKKIYYIIIRNIT